jgi:hypothetical protein
MNLSNQTTQVIMMSYKVKDIKHENGDYWVLDNKESYVVFKTGITHSTSDSAYEHSEDGLSIAIARCNYLANNNWRVL